MLREYLSFRRKSPFDKNPERDYNLTFDFLKYHGEQIRSLEEILPERDAIGVIDGLNGGFSAMVTGGYKNVRRLVYEYSKIKFYDAGFNEIGERDGNIHIIELVPPEQGFYYARVRKHGKNIIIDEDSEKWITEFGSLSPQLVRMQLYEKDLLRGIFRIKSDNLLQQIRKKAQYK